MRLDLNTVVRAEVFDAAGRLLERRETTNFFTEFGEAYVADRLSDRSEANGDIDHMGIGNGSGRDRTATDLAGSVTARVAVTPTQGTGADDNDVIYSATFGTSVPSTDQTITEGGLFTALTGTNLINYFEFSPGIFKSTSTTLVVTLAITVGAS